MRLGRIMTGTNPGGYMLGVSYPSLDAVEATYDRLGNNSSFSNFANKIDINMRSIVRLHDKILAHSVAKGKTVHKVFANAQRPFWSGSRRGLITVSITEFVGRSGRI